MADGWIKLHRQTIDSEWFTDVSTNHLFIYCVIRANHKDTRWQGVNIGRGQFITSLDSLSSGTGLSVRQVRTSLKKLITTSQLTSQSTNKYRLITIVSYDKYQGDDKPVDKPATSQRQTNDKPATTDKNEKNKKKEKKEEALPLWLPLDEWNGFIAERKKQRAAPTENAKKLLIKKLDTLRLSGHDPKEVLEQSIENSWKGLFEVKHGKQFNNTNRTPTAHDNFTAGIALALSEDPDEPLY